VGGGGGLTARDARCLPIGEDETDARSGVLGGARASWRRLTQALEQRQAALERGAVAGAGRIAQRGREALLGFVELAFPKMRPQALEVGGLVVGPDAQIRCVCFARLAEVS